MAISACGAGCFNENYSPTNSNSTFPSTIAFVMRAIEWFKNSFGSEDETERG